MSYLVLVYESFWDFCKLNKYLNNLFDYCLDQLIYYLNINELNWSSFSQSRYIPFLYYYYLIIISIYLNKVSKEILSLISIMLLFTKYRSHLKLLIYIILNCNCKSLFCFPNYPKLSKFSSLNPQLSTFNSFNILKWSTLRFFKFISKSINFTVHKTLKLKPKTPNCVRLLKLKLPYFYIPLSPNPQILYT